MSPNGNDLNDGSDVPKWICNNRPTSHLKVWLDVIPLPTWLEISPYWRSLYEWMPPPGPLLASPIVAPPQLPETSSGVVC